MGKSIEAAETKIPEIESEIEETSAKITQLEGAIEKAKADREDAIASVENADAVRAKAAAEFAMLSGNLSTNSEALTKAVAAIEKGMGGAFLQTRNVMPLRKLLIDRDDLTDFDREQLASFLSGSSRYAPKSGEIVGILKQMNDTMSKELAEATAAEEEAIATHKEMIEAKKKEIELNTKAIETKTELLGEARVSLVQMQDDLSDTKVALEEDKKFLENLEENCKTKTAEHEANMKGRSEELVAVADTIKILNDDDALEIFKKTLPSPSASLLQVKLRGRALRKAALKKIQVELHRQGAARPELNFIALAIMGKKISFGKVLTMIDDMVALLAKEQTDDDTKKASCLSEFDTLDDKKKALEGTLGDLEAMIATEEEAIATLTEEIKALEEGIVALDKSVAEATEQRKEEHTEYEELVASDTQAKEILAFAVNRLNKFYNPELYKAPPKRVLTYEEQVYTNFGGVLPEFFAQVSSHTQREDSEVAPPPPPETADAYKKASESSAGVLTMIDFLVKDLDKEMTVAKVEEEEAQKEYEAFMEASAKKRLTDTKVLADKESAKATTEGDLLKHKDEKTATTNDLMANAEVISSLHGDCDWLLQNFETRKEARAGEVDSLKAAKAVLSGADYS